MSKAAGMAWGGGAAGGGTSLAVPCSWFCSPLEHVAEVRGGLRLVGGRLGRTTGVAPSGVSMRPNRLRARTKYIAPLKIQMKTGMINEEKFGGLA